VRAILVTVALLAAGLQQPTPMPTDLSVADEAIQRLVRAALEDRLAAKSLPDIGLLRDQKRIAIREEMPAARLRLDQRALPHVHGLDFFLIAKATAQAQADRTKDTVTYVIIDRPVINGDEASLLLGVDIAIPPDPKGAKLCCCDADAQFHREKGRWTFVKWGMRRCS
jgi:hypothetical protein